MSAGEIFILCLFLGLIGLILFFCGFLIGNLILSWYKETNAYKLREYPKIDFNDFEIWYRLNPKSWVLRERTVYKVGAKVEMKFSFFDTILYCSWRKRNNKNKLMKQNREQMVEVLKSVKKDIEKFSMENK